MKKNAALMMFFAFSLILSATVSASVAGPADFHEENVVSYYQYDGSVHDDITYYEHVDHCDGYPCRYGLLEVGVPTEDVLQDIRVNLTDTEGTNLNDPAAFRGALASPGGDWSRSRLYINTTESSEDRHYNITDTDIAPSIELEIGWENTEHGGSDLVGSYDIEPTNTLEFTASLTNTGTEELDNITAEIVFYNDENELDTANIISVTEPTVGEVNLHDHTGTGEDETLTWEDGSITGGETEEIVFEAEIVQGGNFPVEHVSVELDDGEGFQSVHRQDDTFTGIEVIEEERFSRGPIRQGTDLSEDEGTWRIRGLIENLADGLTYYLGNWALYEVDEGNGSIVEPSVDEGEFDMEVTSDDGRIYTTDTGSWYEHEGGEKPYYATEIEWHVMWDEENMGNRDTESLSMLDMPELHVVEMEEDKNLEGTLNPETSGEQINISDMTFHIGSEDAPVEHVVIESIIPGETAEGDTAEDPFFQIDDETLKAWYYEDGEDDGTEITEDVDITHTQPGEESSGYVNLTADLDGVGATGDSIGPDERIELEYEVYSNVEMVEGHTFEFSGQSTYETESGTVHTREHEVESIAVSAKRLTGFKDIFAEDPENPTITQSRIVIDVVDETEDEQGIEDIIFVDYLPQGIEFDEGSYTGAIDIEKWDQSEGEWTAPDYSIDELGEVELPDGTTVDAYEYTEDGTDGWTLKNNETLRVSYQFNITESGVYQMPTTIAGFDPVTGTEMGTTASGLYRLELPEPERDVRIEKGDVGLAARPKVGELVEWLKPVEVYNPNNRPVDREFEVELFDEVENAWVIFTEDGETKTIEGRLVEGNNGKIFKWEDRVPALSSKRYEIRILTMPVSEVNRDIEVVEELENQMVKLDMDLYLRNFADVNYDEVLMDLPIPERNIIDAVDGFGEKIRHTGTEDTTTLIIEEFGADELKTITLTYKQPYPTIIVTPEQDVYEADGPVNLSVLVINGGDKIENPKIETALYSPDMRTVESRIKELDSMEPLEETELLEKYVISAHVPSGEYLAEVRFREDFATLATGTGKFYVEGAFSPVSAPITTAIVILALMGAGYITYKRVKSVSIER